MSAEKQPDSILNFLQAAATKLQARLNTDLSATKTDEDDIRDDVSTSSNATTISESPILKLTHRMSDDEDDMEQPAAKRKPPSIEESIRYRSDTTPEQSPDDTLYLSLTIPFGLFKKLLKSCSNVGILTDIRSLPAAPSEVIEICKQTIAKIMPPEEEHDYQTPDNTSLLSGNESNTDSWDN